MVIGKHGFCEALRSEGAFGDDDAPGTQRPDLADDFGNHAVICIDGPARYVAPAKVGLDQDRVTGFNDPGQTAGVGDGLGSCGRVVFAEAQADYSVDNGGIGR